MLDDLFDLFERDKKPPLPPDLAGGADSPLCLATTIIGTPIANARANATSSILEIER